MKATFDLPDDLYKRVKARSARAGRPVRDVVIELFEGWLDDDAESAAAVASDQWLRSWFAEADACFRPAAKGPNARTILRSDRDRLDRK
ncbi:MAG TPA: hypothetical protein VF720_12610 [Candidatus Eisenbacteria bacterium]